MKILNEEGQEVSIEALDLNTGCLDFCPSYQTVYKEQEQTREYTYYIPTKVFFNDGSIRACSLGDAEIIVEDKEKGLFQYKRTSQDIALGRVVTGISIQKKTETVQENIQIPTTQNVGYLQYRKYTSAELENKQLQKERQVFMSQGPAQINTMQADIDTIILALAEVTGA